MKKSYVFPLAVILAVSFGACKKDDKPSQGNGTQISAEIATEMSKIDSLSSFNSYFKVARFSSTDVSTGLTVFALPNRAFGDATIKPGDVLPDSSLLKDYIVKGVYTLAQLRTTTTLTALSGKTLTVTTSGNLVYINGILLESNPVESVGKYMIYVAAQLWKVSDPVSVTVWDATQWASDKTKGVVSAGATVSLYAHAEDLIGKVNPVATATTGADGKAVFSRLSPGEYFAVATKGSLTSVLKIYAEGYNGTYLGYAIDGVTLDNAGNYIQKDVNMDGKIDANDVAILPADKLTAAKGAGVNIEMSMGYAFKQLKTQEEAQTILDGLYTSGLKTMYESLLVADGVLSDDADCGTQTSWCPFDNFTFTANQTPLDKIWSTAYFNGINKLNYILRDVPAMNIADDVKKDLIAQAHGLRGYIYLQLMTYFGDIPIHNDLAASWHPAISRKAVATVYDSVVADLKAAQADLPLTRTGKGALVKDAATVLLAKAALYKKDYASVLTYTNSLISGGSYTMAPLYTWLGNSNTTETIWAPNFTVIGGSSNWYFVTEFVQPSVDLVPVLRYTQVLLMNAEAKIMTNGDLISVGTTLNQIRQRDGLSAVVPTNASGALTAFSETWKKDMYRQGDRYACLVRWGAAGNFLAAKGWTQNRSLLPVPMNYINGYPNLVQNAGY